MSDAAEGLMNEIRRVVAERPDEWLHFSAYVRGDEIFAPSLTRGHDQRVEAMRTETKRKGVEL